MFVHDQASTVCFFSFHKSRGLCRSAAAFLVRRCALSVFTIDPTHTNRPHHLTMRPLMGQQAASQWLPCWQCCSERSPVPAHVGLFRGQWFPRGPGSATPRNCSCPGPTSPPSRRLRGATDLLDKPALQALMGSQVGEPLL